MNQKKILAGCVTISLIIHTLFLGFIQTHSLWFYSTLHSNPAPASRSFEIVSRDQILKESFIFLPDSNAVQPHHEKPSSSCANLTTLRVLKPKPPTEMSPTLFPHSIQDLLSPKSDLFTFEISSLRNADFFFELPENLILPVLHSSPSSPTLPLSSKTSSTAFATHSPKPGKPSEAELVLKSENSSMPDTTARDHSHVPNIVLGSLPQLPSLADLCTVNLSEAFEAELTFLPRPDGTGYFFALTLIPHEELDLPKIHQRITFLIDRANSVQQDRLFAAKQAVLRVVEELDPEDSFNIIAFDNWMDKLFHAPQAPVPEAIAKAEDFLNQTSLASFFSSSDFYKPLLHTIPGTVQEDEVYTTILLTDGEGLSKKNMSQAILRDWSLQNHGKVSLYVISMESDSNLTTLETLCALNRGRLIQSATERGLKRQLQKLAKNIQIPLAKDLTSKAISRAPNQHIEIFPNPPISPHLYLNQPYVIMGTTETLDDFLIFIQGRFKDRWVNIKKSVSFLNAKKGGASLKNAFQRYEKIYRE